MTRTVIRRAIGTGIWLMALGVTAEQTAGRLLPTEVPFDSPHGLVLVQVTLPDASSAGMVIDSGVFPSVIDNSIARRLELRTSGGGLIAGMGRRDIRHTEGTLPSLALDGFVLRDLPIVSTDVTHLSERLPMVGILGESFFRRAIVEIDYPKRKVRLWPPSADPPYPAGISLGADVSGVTPRFELTVNGHTISAWLDTGAQSGLRMSEATARSVGLAEALTHARSVEGMGSRGTFEAKLIRVPRVIVAGMAVRDVNALVVPSGPTWVGNEVWDEFRVRFDYGRGQVTISRP